LMFNSANATAGAATPTISIQSAPTNGQKYTLSSSQVVYTDPGSAITINDWVKVVVDLSSGDPAFLPQITAQGLQIRGGGGSGVAYDLCFDEFRYEDDTGSSASSASSASGGDMSVPSDPYPHGYSWNPPSPITTYNRGTYLRIGSVNIQIFGTTKQGRYNTHTILASLATNFDILAIQEVGSNGNPSDTTATTVMNNYVARVNEIAAAAGLTAALGTYSYVRGHQYAFVYRREAVSVAEYQLYSGGSVFTYPPLAAKFTTPSGFEFALLTIHTSPEKATTEIPAIAPALGDVENMYNVAKVGCLGDYNGDGGYYGTQAGTVAQGWLGGFAPSAGWFTGIRNGTDTTVATGNNYTYDRMQLTHPFAWHYTGSWGVLNYTQVYGAEAIQNCEGAKTDAGKEDALSDHYPVWMQFRYVPYQVPPD